MNDDPADPRRLELVRIILRDPQQPLMWERQVEVFRGYAEMLIDQGRARWETPNRS